MRQLLETALAADGNRAATVDDADAGARASGQDRIAGVADGIDVEQRRVPAEHLGLRRRVRRRRRHATAEGRLGAARGARDLGAVVDDVLHQPEGVLEDVAHQVRYREAEVGRPALDLFVERFGHAGMDDPLLPRPGVVGHRCERSYTLYTRAGSTIFSDSSASAG